MYREYLGLHEYPFGVTPDTNFVIPTRCYQEAFHTLSVAVQNGAGFSKITGEVGTGKTLLCRKFLASLGPEYVTAYIHNPYLQPHTLLLALADELSIPLPGTTADSNNQHHLLKLLTQALSDIAQQGKRAVLCIDEAQAMPLVSMEALRLLTNLETEKHKLLQVVLFGQPELDEKLHQDSVRQLLQRIVFQHHLKPLASDEIGHYLTHRLSMAGYQGEPLFPPSVVQVLHRATRGIPRLINIVAHKALLLACRENSRPVKKRHVRAAVLDTPAAKQSFWRIAVQVHHALRDADVAVLRTLRRGLLLLVGLASLLMTMAMEQNESMSIAAPPQLPMVTQTHTRARAPTPEKTAQKLQEKNATDKGPPHASHPPVTLSHTTAPPIAHEKRVPLASAPASVPSKKASKPSHGVAAATPPPATSLTTTDGTFIKSPTTPSHSTEDEYATALLTLRQGRLEEAEAEFTQVLQHHPHHHAACLALANIALSRGDQPAAEQILRKGLRLDPKSATLAFPLARMVVEHGNAQEGLAILHAALPNAGNDPRYHAFVAALDQRVGDHQDAITQYRTALRSHPSNAIWLMGLGISLAAEHRNDEARQVFRVSLNGNGLNTELRAYVERQLQTLEHNETTAEH